MATAQAVTITEVTHTSVKKITWDWLSTDLGVVVGSVTTNAYDGKLIALVTDPGATAPTADYDITIKDADGVDVLIGTGTDRHTSNTEIVASASLGAVAGSTLTLAIASAGDAKIGKVYLYIR